jgi:L-asparaginase
MKLMLITTGGTIASVPTEEGFAPRLSGEHLVDACPLLKDFGHDLEILDIFSKDSSNIGPPDWLAIAKALRQFAGTVDAVVVLHGTDTMAWTASALSYLLHGVSVPVVLTGSMLPPGDGSDAPDNIFTAFQFALQLAKNTRAGVCVAFADRLIHGARVTKLDSRRLNAFVSVDYPILGEMVADGSRKIAMLTPFVPSLSGKGPWDDEPVFETDIALVPVFPGMKTAFLDAVIAKKPKAVVLEGFGLGNIPMYTEHGAENLLPSIKRGIEAGIPFIVRTQAPYGGTDLSVYAVGRGALDLGVISARDMTREALMVKLMLLLPLFSNGKLKEHLYAKLCDDIATEP